MSHDATLVRYGENAAEVVANVLRQFDGFETYILDRPEAESALVAVVPDGKRVEDLKPILDRYLLRPERIRGTAQLYDLESFIRHIRRFAVERSVVFANPNRQTPSFVAVYDYHDATDDEPDWLEHRAQYRPELSEEWKVWSAHNGKPMAQADFAAFIEDRIVDLVVPDITAERIKGFADVVQGRWAMPTEVHELSRNLAVNVETAVRNAITLNTGEITVVYDEQHKDGAGQPIRVANLFQIAIPVFYAGDTYRIAARLRYRLNSGKVTWTYQLVRPDLIFDDAFKGIVTKIDEETEGPPVFLGQPEA